MTNRKAGGAIYEFAPPAGAQRGEMLMRSTRRENCGDGAIAAGNWKTIGKLANGVVRRVRWQRALN